MNHFSFRMQKQLKKLLPEFMSLSTSSDFFLGIVLKSDLIMEKVYFVYIVFIVLP